MVEDKGHSICIPIGPPNETASAPVDAQPLEETTNEKTDGQHEAMTAKQQNCDSEASKVGSRQVKLCTCAESKVKSVRDMASQTDGE